MTKTLLSLTLVLTALISYSQDWTTCSTTSGKLSGSSESIGHETATPTPIYAVNPSPAGTIPESHFLVVLKDSLAFDTLGNTIIRTSSDGIMTPTSLGLSLNDTFEIVSFSYELEQFQTLTQGLLHNSVPFLGSCCDVLDSQQPTSGTCDTLNALGIFTGTDVKTLQDVLNVISVFKYGTIKSMSIQGLNDNLVAANEQLQTLNSLGCTNGIDQVCFALDSSSTGRDQYIVNTVTTIFNSELNAEYFIYPNPSNGNFTIDLGANYQNLRTSISNLRGETILSPSYNQSQLVDFTIGQPSGVYVLTIESDDKISSIRIIKK